VCVFISVKHLWNVEQTRTHVHAVLDMRPVALKIHTPYVTEVPVSCASSSPTDTNPQRLGQASQLNHNSLNSVTFPSDPVCIQNSVVLPYLFLLNVQCQFDWFSVIHSAGCVFTFVVMFLLKIPCGENQVFKGTLHPFAVSFV